MEKEVLHEISLSQKVIEIMEFVFNKPDLTREQADVVVALTNVLVETIKTVSKEEDSTMEILRMQQEIMRMKQEDINHIVDIAKKTMDTKQENINHIIDIAKKTMDKK